MKQIDFFHFFALYILSMSEKLKKILHLSESENITNLIYITLFYQKLDFAKKNKQKFPNLELMIFVPLKW